MSRDSLSLSCILLLCTKISFDNIKKLFVLCLLPSYLNTNGKALNFENYNIWFMDTCKFSEIFSNKFLNIFISAFFQDPSKWKDLRTNSKWETLKNVFLCWLYFVKCLHVCLGGVYFSYATPCQHYIHDMPFHQTDVPSVTHSHPILKN